MAGNLNNIIVYDLETGGFTPGVHGVCEVAMIAIDINTLEEIGRYEAIIQPYQRQDGTEMQYEPGAFKVNGLSVKKIQNGKPGSVVVKEIIAFAKAHKSKSKKPILSGHNIDKFDNPHLDDLFLCHKADVTKHFENDSIDTLKWARLKWIDDPDMVKFNLGACCKKLGIRLIDAHSAMPDTEANKKVLISFLKSLRGDGLSTEEDYEAPKKDRVEFKF